MIDLLIFKTERRDVQLLVGIYHTAVAELVTFVVDTVAVVEPVERLAVYDFFDGAVVVERVVDAELKGISSLLDRE